MPAIPFVDLHPGEDAADVRDAIDRVIARGWFVLGPEVEAFEAEFAAASGATHTIGVASGTDAITLLLRGLGIGAGDEVLVPAITAAYTALAVIAAGATPIVVDVDEATLTMDPGAAAAAVTPSTAAIVPVHLYGQAADLRALGDVATRHRLALVEDCCQAHLATHHGTAVGTASAGGAFSFYPTKNLGALGDGGAAITQDAALAERIRRLRNGGQSTRYHHDVAGINSRLDEMQAAVLRARLPRLTAWTARRRALARDYRRQLPAFVVPIAQRDPGHVYHLFVARSVERDALQAWLRREGVETLIHYPVGLHRQAAFAAARRAECPVADAATGEILSLPLHPRLDPADVEKIARLIAAFGDGHGRTSA